MRHGRLAIALFALLATPEPHPAHAAGRELLRFDGHGGSVYSAEFSADGRRVLTCGADDTARLWDVTSGKELAAFRHPPAKKEPYGEGRLALTRLSPDGRRVLTVTANEYCHDADAWPGYRSYGSGGDLRANDAARLWDAPTGKVIAEWSADQPGRAVHGVNPFGAAFSPDGKMVVTTFGSDLEKAARVHESVTGKERFRLEGHGGPVVEFAFSPDGKWLATASLDQTAKVWDASTGKCVQTFKGHASGVTGVAFSPNGRRLLTHCAGYTHRFELKPNGSSGGGSSVNDVIGRVWDVETGKEALALAWGTVPGMTSSREIRVGPLGLRLDTTGLGDRLGFVKTACFSPDGKTLLTAGVVGCSAGQDERHPMNWDAATGKRLVSFRGEAFRDVLAATFSPDGKHVAAAGKSGVVRVWDAASGREQFAFRGHTKLVRTVAFSRDGTRLLSASDDGTARVWDLAGKP